MASKILVVRPSGAYTLPETDRQKILAQAPSHMLSLEIERQRLAFIKTHGSQFGIRPMSPKTAHVGEAHPSNPGLASAG